jgi:hypothetical protein
MKRILSLTALAAAAALYAMPAAAPAQTPGQRINRIVVYGKDRCPRASGNDITICARRGENERYRIPEALRDEATSPDPENTSWAARAETLEYVGRTGTQSCSTVGPGGFTGCWAELIRAARGDRRTEGEPGR